METFDPLTWKQLLSRELGRNFDCWRNLEYSTLSDIELDSPVNSGGKHFILWTDKYVYFSIFDANLKTVIVSNVPRNPDKNFKPGFIF